MRQFLRETDQFFADFMPKVTRRFFYTIIGVFVLSALLYMVFGATTVHPVTGEINRSLADRLLVLVPVQAVLQGHLWQFVTYMFTHAGLGHLFVNILVLFFFGGLVEQQMGGRRFFWFVIAAGVAAGMAHTAMAFATGNQQTGLVGFSGAVFAILTAAVIWFPRMRVLVMFLFPVPLRVLAAIFGFFMVLSIIEDVRRYGPMGGRVSELAHVTGILMAILMVKVPRVLDFFEDLRIPFLMRPRPKRVRRVSMGHPGRHTDPDDLYDDPHWKLDQ